MMTIIDRDLHSCEKCGKPFEPRSGSGGSVQRFCCTACRLCFHRERLRAQRTGSYAGQLPEPATQELQRFLSRPSACRQADADQRRRLIERLLAKMPPDKPEK